MQMTALHVKFDAGDKWCRRGDDSYPKTAAKYLGKRIEPYHPAFGIHRQK